MHILGDDWRDEYLDYHKHEDELRIAVRAWWPVEELSDVFIPQPRSVRRVWNYIRVVGIRATLRKIRSRLGERLRDQRVVAIGIGQVLETCTGQPHRPGDSVVFVAPCHPRCVERVVLPAECVRPTIQSVLSRLDGRDTIYWFGQSQTDIKVPREVRGWNRLSGRRIESAVVPLLEDAERVFSTADPAQARQLPIRDSTGVIERGGVSKPPGALKRAVVFGLGNYAKTCIIPNLGPDIELACVHEIDPTQIGPVTGAERLYDTDPHLRDDEKYDLYFIAGYHHTHADQAIEALDRGGCVVVEKPLATTHEQLARLVEAMRRHPGRLYAGYYMRYSPLYETARQDLGLRPKEPVHYHCIVYEIPLQTNHWYNWPVTRSRILSNGPHWIDHFLYLNDFSRPAQWDLWRGGNNDLHISVELQNGAVFGMVLTDVGSRRTGVQQRVELRAGNVTIRTDDDLRYQAEDDVRVIRSKTVNKSTINAHKYRKILDKIAKGEPGESCEAVQTSCELMLRLDELAVASGAGAAS